jgi:hypothetical protein
MATEQLNIHDLLTLTNTRASDFAEAPEGLCIGHVHLRVGDLAQAEGFYHWPRSGAPPQRRLVPVLRALSSSSRDERLAKRRCRPTFCRGDHS